MDPKPKKDTLSSSAGSNDTFPPDVSTIVREAEAIARGETPSSASSNDAGDPKAGTAGEGTRAPAPAAPLPSDGDRLLAGQIVEFSDKAFIAYFGPGSGFGTFERDIAINDWSHIVAEYMPKVLASSPGWRLIGLYLAHAALIQVKLWNVPTKNDSSPATSDGADQGKHT
jgi:hypothetical protein